MNGKTFRFHVRGVILVVFAASILSLVASILWANYGKELRAVPSVLIPLGGAWLAFCWQRRIAFTKALFDIWQKTVVTVQEARQYTFLPKPSQEHFARVMQSTSCRIDDIRGAFRNVGERHIEMSDEDKRFVLNIKNVETFDKYTDVLQKYLDHNRRGNRRGIGVYPFESLKQIGKVISHLGFGEAVTPGRSLVARKTIDALWKILRSELLKELDRDFPEHPDTPFDPPKRSFWSSAARLRHSRHHK
jgi:hypothetical protein